ERYSRLVRKQSINHAKGGMEYYVYKGIFITSHLLSASLGLVVDTTRFRRQPMVLKNEKSVHFFPFFFIPVSPPPQTNPRMISTRKECGVLSSLQKEFIVRLSI
ncbi:unnamed protein product, partial [Pylaiella littoralis]